MQVRAIKASIIPAVNAAIIPSQFIKLSGTRSKKRAQAIAVKISLEVRPLSIPTAFFKTVLVVKDRSFLYLFVYITALFRNFQENLTCAKITLRRNFRYKWIF